MFYRTAGTIAAAGILASTIAMSAPNQDNYARLRGAIRIDGSSTVYPITEAVAEEFSKLAENVRVTVGISGTGGGFKRFAIGETDISDASRPIKKSEADQCAENNIKFVEVPVAYDGLSIVINRENYWVDQLTVDDLKKIFLTANSAKTWKDVNPAWPDRPIKVYSPGTDSGTFDYFKEVVAGKEGTFRSDMSVSEDDNVLVNGVVGDGGAIGYFGCAYYFENKDKLKVVPIVNPETKKAVEPTPETIEGGDYAPFSRPLFIYVNSESLNRREVKAFIDYYLKNAPRLSAKVGYVALPEVIYERATRNVQTKRNGSQYLDENGEHKKGPVTKVYQ